jgi:hypothetical protein
MEEDEKQGRGYRSCDMRIGAPARAVEMKSERSQNFRLTHGCSCRRRVLFRRTCHIFVLNSWGHTESEPSGRGWGYQGGRLLGFKD